MISFVMEVADVGFVEACEILSNGRLPELSRPLPADWVRMAEPRPPRKLSRTELALSTAEGTEALDLAARVYHTTLVVGPKGPDSPYGYLLRRGLTVEAIAEQVPLEFQPCPEHSRPLAGIVPSIRVGCLSFTLPSSANCDCDEGCNDATLRSALL